MNNKFHFSSIRNTVSTDSLDIIYEITFVLNDKMHKFEIHVDSVLNHEPVLRASKIRERICKAVYEIVSREIVGDIIAHLGTM